MGAAENLCNPEDYARLQKYYDGRAPFYHTAPPPPPDIVSFEEDRTPGEICRIIGKRTRRLMLGGELSEWSTNREASDIRDTCACVWAEFGVSVEIKRRCAPNYEGSGPPIRRILTPFAESATAEKIQPDVKRTGSTMRLYTSARCIGVSDCYAEPTSPSTYSDARYN